MSAHFDNPFSVFAIALVAQIIAAFVGDFLRRRAHSFKQGERHDFNTVQAATLTLLALIIGFSFSMAVSRYDQRKALEEAEANANAIGTEYLRADLLPSDSGSRTHELLKKYLDLRIAFYQEATHALPRKSQSRRRACKVNFGPLCSRCELVSRHQRWRLSYLA